MTDSRCDLCDLPLSQCVHGVRTPETLPKTAAAKRATAAKRKPAKQKFVSRPIDSVVSSISAGPSKVELPKATAVCTKCRKRPRYGKFALCRSCALRDGAVACRTCGTVFRPKATVTSKKKPRCGACSSSKGKDVYVTAQAGSPGLGRRA